MRSFPRLLAFAFYASVLVLTLGAASCPKSGGRSNRNREFGTYSPAPRSAVSSGASFASPPASGQVSNFTNQSAPPTNRNSCGLANGFVHLKSVAPTIKQDMRYATRNNFVGQALAGYGSEQSSGCVVRKEVAQALKKAQEQLQSKHPNLSLMVYDCYRPKQAQEQMRQKISDGNYVAQNVSNHSKGIAIDVTIVDIYQGQKEVPMGSKFDDFSQRAHYIGDGHDHAHPPGLEATPQVNQGILRNLITGTDHCMKPYGKEWWHFTYACGGAIRSNGENFAIPAFNNCHDSDPYGESHRSGSGNDQAN